MFKSSRNLAQRAIEVLQRAHRGKPQPQAVGAERQLGFRTSASPSCGDQPRVHLHPASAHPPKREVPTPDQARIAIGERLESVLQVLSRECGMLEPGARVVVLDNQERFSRDLLPRILEIFGDREAAEVLMDVVDSLAVEFCAWVKENPEDQTRLGLRIDRDGRVILDCPAPPLPVHGLEPLPPLDE